MGFFKNIGKTVKKATKQISFKNVVKLAGTAANAIPGVGGLVSGAIQNAQAAHQAKKEEQRAIDVQNNAEAEYQAQQAQEYAKQASVNVAGVTKTIAGQMVTAGWQGANAGVKSGASNVTAEIMQGGIKTWLKKYWYVLLIVPTIIIVPILMLRKKQNSRLVRGK